VTICCGQNAGRLREVYAQAVARSGFPVGPPRDLEQEGAVAMGLYAIAASIAKNGITVPGTTPQVRKIAQKLGQLQPFLAVFLQECMGQHVYFGPT
jgi:hypothetical protein